MSDIVSHASLTTGMVSFWEFDETSGTRVDAHGSNDLTDTNTVGSTTGVIGNAANFVAANSEELSITDASQSGLDITGDISIAGFFNLTNLTPIQEIVWKDATSSGAYVYHLSLINSANEFEFAYRSSNAGGAGNQTRFQSTSTLGSLGVTAGTTFHFAISVNVSAASCIMRLDDTAISVDTNLSNATSMYDSNGSFRVGAQAGAAYMNGWADQLGIWSKQLSTSEITYLFNSGSGREYEASGGGSEPTYTPRIVMF